MVYLKPLTSVLIGGIFATMRVVLDTNILVAASRSNKGASYRILQLIPDERFQICLSMPLYLEYLDVLTRPEHRIAGLSEQQVVGTVRYLAAQAHLQEIYFHWRPFLPDSNDDMILELAAAAQAKRIVTFNLKDFRGVEQFGVLAIRPRDFLVEIGEIT
jgi:putative PIN family toxin of toxin-antitoxin system